MQPIRLLIALLLSTIVAPALAQDAVKREISQVSGDLYRFQNHFHYSVFLVTDQGVIATDPINAEAAAWLKAEIEQRFGQPITHVIYSHFHADHISGGEVFAGDGVEIIAHEKTARNIEDNAIPTAAPTKTFSDALTLELGGQKVELRHLGRSHSDDLIVVHFPAQRALFTVDFISVKRLPYRTLRGAFFPDWFEAIDKVAAMDFDILMPGHGALGGKQDAIDHGQYLRDLYARVKAGKDAGESAERLQVSIEMDEYSGWGQYDAWLKENIQGMYDHVD